MKTTLKISIFAVLFLCSAVAWAQDSDFADKTMQTVNEALTQGDCDRAQRNYNVWKVLTKKTNSSIERQIKECKGSDSFAPMKNYTQTVDAISFDMIFVEGGTFTMGSELERLGSNEYFTPHKVTLSSFCIGKHEVTQALWQMIMGENNSYFKGDNLPVETVSYRDIQEFLRILNKKTGRNYRLPTEAEWEFAAKGGNKSNGYEYSGGNDVNNVLWAWTQGTHPVGQLVPNELGIYDMSGNVWEWCNDRFGAYSSSAQNNPEGPDSGTNRVIRGGSWYGDSGDCRVYNRASDPPGKSTDDLGFRLACSVE